MKINTKLLSLLVLSTFFIFTACKKDDPSPEEQKLNELQGTWTINEAVTPDGTIPLTDVSINVTAENQTYAITGLGILTDNNLNNGEVLEASGSFTLNPDNLNEMILSNGTVVSIVVTGSDFAASYSAPFQKATDPEATITLNATKQ